MAEAEDKDLVDGVSDDCVHLLFLCQHRQWVTTHSPHFQILGLICYVVISILRPKIIYKKEEQITTYLRFGLNLSGLIVIWNLLLYSFEFTH